MQSSSFHSHHPFSSLTRKAQAAYGLNPPYRPYGGKKGPLELELDNDLHSKKLYLSINKERAVTETKVSDTFPPKTATIHFGSTLPKSLFNWHFQNDFCALSTL
jgi:hypothetical protein